jgi:hypothetical protein
VQQDGGLADFGIMDPVRIEAGCRQAGREEIAPLQDPQHRAGQPGEASSDEQGSRSAMRLVGARAHHLMQGT